MGWRPRLCSPGLAALGIPVLLFVLWQSGRSQEMGTASAKLGEPLPELTLLDATGKRNALAALHQDQPVLLAFVPAAELAAACEPEKLAWEQVRSKLSQYRVGLLLVSEKRSETCAATLPLFYDSTGEARKVLKASSRSHALVDEDGSLRWIKSSRDLAKQTAEIMHEVPLWTVGRTTFQVECGHCHGRDGLDTSYPNVKTMAGITRRMEWTTILRRAAEAGAVDIEKFSARERDALYLFMSGL